MGVVGETQIVAVDTTWGELQPLEIAPGVRPSGSSSSWTCSTEAVDSRTSGSLGGRTIPGAVRIRHDETVERQAELTRDGLTG